MRRALPLSVQLLLTFVGLLIGLAAVLSSAAYNSLVANLETEAARQVSAATRSREQALTQIFHLRQQHAEEFLDRLESLCADPVDSGRLVWADGCVPSMVEGFRQQRACARRPALLPQPYRLPERRPCLRPLADRRSARDRASHRRRWAELRDEDQAPRGVPDAEVRRRPDRTVVRRSAGLRPHRRGLSSWTREDSSSPLPASRHPAHRRRSPSSWRAAGWAPTASSATTSAAFTAFRVFGRSMPLAARASAPPCATPARWRRPRSCVRTSSAAARGSWPCGIVLSLLAAHWISAPVRRLAASARKLQTGRFTRPLPLGGPSEVRALGRAFNEMSNDLAELVAKEQAARRDAEDANRAKDDFLATVSHELRTPLTAILGWAQMLRADGVPADRLRHGLAVIERSARAQRQLIDDLLDVSRIVSNRLRIAREPVPARARWSRRRSITVRPQAAAKHIAIETDVSPSAALVLGDPRRLEQVVWNLVWNAIKFTRAAGRDHGAARARSGSRPRAVGQRHRGRHLLGVPAARLRVVPPGGRAGAQPVRPRTRSRHRPPHRAAARRQRARREPRCRPGRDLHRYAAGARAGRCSACLRQARTHPSVLAIAHRLDADARARGRRR